MSVIPLVPHAPSRYHLLLVQGGPEADFRELVAASGIVQPAAQWWGTVDGALDVSSVEADARLARWSRRTNGLGVRITRADPTRWWLAVHHSGERLFAMVHTHETPDGLAARNPMLTDAELGRDPLLDLEQADDLTAAEVRHRVAAERSQQLSAALAAGGVEIDEGHVADLLANLAPDDGNLAELLDALGARALYALSSRVPPDALSTVSPRSVRRVLSRAVLMGCALPLTVSTGLFVMFTTFGLRAGLGRGGSLLLGLCAAWTGLLALRRGMRTQRRSSRTARWAGRAVLGWAAEDLAPPEQAIRPTASALNTWGGLFYLLRDIAFFGGIDRPRGPMALYVEAWGQGPPALVEAINRASVTAGQDASHEDLFDAAHALVHLRTALIDQHLAGDDIAAEAVVRRVRAILGPAVR